jgi:biopolymer transport protein ExbD
MAIPSNEGGGGVFAEINITPLTDIFLVLLIIFMVAAAVTIESAAHIALPHSSAAPSSHQLDTVLVKLTAQRQIYVNDKPVAITALQPALVQALKDSPRKIVIFQGDPQVIVGDMVILLDLARRAGAEQLGVTVAESNEAPGGPGGNPMPAAPPVPMPQPIP